jgi:hypothetical protein
MIWIGIPSKKMFSFWTYRVTESESSLDSKSYYLEIPLRKQDLPTPAGPNTTKVFWFFKLVNSFWLYSSISLTLALYFLIMESTSLKLGLFGGR